MAQISVQLRAISGQVQMHPHSRCVQTNDSLKAISSSLVIEDSLPSCGSSAPRSTPQFRDQLQVRPWHCDRAPILQRDVDGPHLGLRLEACSSGGSAATVPIKPK